MIALDGHPIAGDLLEAFGVVPTAVMRQGNLTEPPSYR